MGKIFNKGLSEDDKKERLFKRLKNIENDQKGLIGGNDEDKDKKTLQNNNNIDTKQLNVFDYLKSLSQEANYLMHELLFLDSNNKRFNFNIFNKSLNFISAIYNGKISLKEADFKQIDLEKRIEDLRDHKNNAEEEKKKK